MIELETMNDKVAPGVTQIWRMEYKELEREVDRVGGWIQVELEIEIDGDADKMELKVEMGSEIEVERFPEFEKESDRLGD